ncbi:MAG: peptidoglycan-binding protein [Actinobacteria bacterium]|nr:peptidoglycan-binding protein [Actinomycetota bacterium]
MLHGTRRIIVIVVSLIAIPVGSAAATPARPAVHVAAPTTDPSPLAKRGDRSPTVKKMQELLSKAGIRVAGGADGIFGAGTEAAVKEFQTRRGLTPNGTLDLPTAIVLGMVKATPLLSRGARGEDVRVVQQQLITVGLPLRGGADGVFGAVTVTAVKSFQRSKGLAATGSVDAATAAILANAAAALTPTTTAPPDTAPPDTAPPATAPPDTAPPDTAPPATAPPATAPPATAPPANGVLLKLGDRGEAVAAMQRRLIAVGIAVFGGADGVFGPATQAALTKFQTQAALPANGVLDSVTDAALTAAAAAAPTAPPTTTPAAPPTPGVVVLTVPPIAATCAFMDSFGAARSGGRRHEGVDIIVASGTPIYAVVDGRISRKQLTFPGSLGGNALWLTAADATYFFFAHLSAFAEGIEIGSVVTAGTVIGFVGATGNAGTAHLHFEVHPGGGAAVNPYPIVKAASHC